MIDLSQELANALASPKVKEALGEVLREVMRAGSAADGMTDQLVGADEAARLLSMTVAAVHKAAARGTLPCHRFGRRVRFRVSELLGIREGK